MQLKPQEMFVVVRQLGDPLDAGTYYVQAKIRNAHTDALIATLNLVNSGGQRFTKEWQVVADTSGEGFYVDIETIVYTDSGYSSVSDVYQRENAVYLVQDRQTPPFGGAGGGDVSYDKIRTIMTEVVEKAKPKESGKKPQKIDLTGAEKRILAAIKGVQEAVDAVEVPDNAPELKRLADASVEAKDAILKAIGDRAEFEPTDLSPVLERIEKAETTIAGKVADAFTRMAKGFTGEIDTLREVATKLVNAFNGTLFMVAGPRPKDEKVEMPAPQRPERKRRMPGSAGFVSMAAVAIIGALSVAGFIGYGVYQNAAPIAADPTEVALGDTVSTLPQFTSTTSPSSAITQRTFGKDIRLTGYESLTCLGTDSNGMLQLGTCTGGGGGGGGGPFSTTTNSLGIYNNVADQVLITDDNRTSTSTDGIIELERDAATTTIAFVATGINPAYRQGLDFWESTKNLGWLYDGSGTGDDNKIGLYDYTTGTMDFFINKGGGFLATGSSTINANATTTGMHGVGSLFINSERFTDLTGAGLTISSNALTVNDVTAAMLNAEDFGSFTCNGTSCTVDSQAITASMMANADFGDWTCSGGSCTIDANAIALGTDTAGNYVATVTSSGSITVGNSGSETAAVTVDLNMGNANTWTALQTFTNASTTGYHSFGTASSTNWTGGGLTDCDTAATSKLLYDVTTQKFSCGTDQNTGGGGGSGNVATSSAETQFQLPWWDSTAATPALLNGGEAALVYSPTLDKLTVTNASTTNLTVGTLARPNTDDGAPLGASGLEWSDLFLNTGGVINWEAGDVTITHSANTLTFAGVTGDYIFDDAVRLATNDTGALGSATVSWSDLFLADGGVVNWGNGGVTLTHTSASDSMTWALDAANALGSTLFTWALDGANELILSASALYPSTDDGLTLGIANTNEWADIFLNTGGVINWANGDVTLTHASGQLTTSADNFGVATSTPWGRLGVTGADANGTNALIIANSADTPLLRVQNNGTTTISGITAATSTIYGFSTAASKGAVIILEDVDGAGCTEVSALNGVLTAITVTCPTEN